MQVVECDRIVISYLGKIERVLEPSGKVLGTCIETELCEQCMMRLKSTCTDLHDVMHTVLQCSKPQT
jgi:hypothetical protein